MDIAASFCSQYLAALEMLKQTISLCPEPVWDAPADETKFWHIAYHALYFTHLYLHDTRQSFKPWPLHREQYQYLGGHLPFKPDERVHIGEPYTPSAELEFLAFCQQQIIERVPCTNMEAASGFEWLPFNKFELQIYNIRHLQEHTGELMERLGTRTHIQLDWVGLKRA